MEYEHESLKTKRGLFDFQEDEEKLTDEHKIALQSEGFWAKRTCCFYISHGLCFCIGQGSLIATWEIDKY